MTSLMTSCVKNADSDKPLVVTGIAPIAALIQEIGGSVIVATNIVPNNVDPHDFQLKGSDAVLVAKASIVIALDDHIDGYLMNLEDKDNTYVLNEDSHDDHHDDHHDHAQHDHDHHHNHDHDHKDHDHKHHDHHAHHNHDHHEHGHNAHTWLSYEHSEELADEVLHILSEHFPAHEEDFAANHEAFVERLQASYTSNKNKAKNVYVVQRHAAWDYLFEELGITLIGTLEEVEGVAPSGKKVVTLITEINKLSDNDKVILVDDAFSSSSTSLKQVAEETGSVIKSFNPLVSPEGKGDIVSILDAYSELLLN